MAISKTLKQRRRLGDGLVPHGRCLSQGWSGKFLLVDRMKDAIGARREYLSFEVERNYGAS